jgi:hypothetical protein
MIVNQSSSAKTADGRGLAGLKAYLAERLPMRSGASPRTSSTTWLRIRINQGIYNVAG